MYVCESADYCCPTAENDESFILSQNEGSFWIFQIGFFRQEMKVHYEGSLKCFLVNSKNLAFLQYLKILHKNAHNLNFLLKWIWTRLLEQPVLTSSKRSFIPFNNENNIFMVILCGPFYLLECVTGGSTRDCCARA